jgi:glycosyltransferase involved in cell wall biosynthesis
VEEFKANEDVGLVLKFMLPQEVTAQRVAEEIRDFLKGTLKLSGPIPKLDIHLDPVCPGLYRAVDAFVLPCRAERLGRHCMEAMASGLPVIATGWGGQTEFMNSENAYLIQYSLTDVPESVVDQSPHLEGSRWAEPSVEHLRFLMRQVLENRAEAKQKGQKAREHIAMNYSREQIARQVKERLEAIFENVKARVGQ